MIVLAACTDYNIFSGFVCLFFFIFFIPTFRITSLIHDLPWSPFCVSFSSHCLCNLAVLFSLFLYIEHRRNRISGTKLNMSSWSFIKLSNNKQNQYKKASQYWRDSFEREPDFICDCMWWDVRARDSDFTVILPSALLILRLPQTTRLKTWLRWYSKIFVFSV